MAAKQLEATHELVLTRRLDASPHALWRCWTEPELMKRWYTPRPWTTPAIEVDLRVGGGTYVKMRGPNGEEHDHHGVYLELVPDRRIVFTDAYRAGWIPTGNPFFTGIVDFVADRNGAIYTARARHWREEDMKTHERMGFHDGWGKAADQLQEVAKSL
jgi:uncharacterized protein YndB with AHSA1/START domain